MNEFMQSVGLLLVILNPFLLIVYLTDVVQKLDRRLFTKVVIRAALIASAVFCCFATLGNKVFTDFLRADFASFQIFGGIVFLLIGLQFVFHGPSAITLLRGESEHLAGSIAMPIFIGPGSISGCVIIGEKHEPLAACSIVIVAVGVSVIVMLALKAVHDVVRPRHESLVQRYIEIAGRITALYVGTISVEMIMLGLASWVHKF